MRALLLCILVSSLGLACATSSDAKDASASSTRPMTSTSQPEDEAAPASVTAPAAVDPALRDRAQKVLAEALASTDGETRSEALTALGVARTPDASSLLAAALADPGGDIRFAAARGLRHLADPNTADAITQAWKKEKGWSVKKELALAAGATGANDLVPELQSVVAGEHRREVKIAAAWALKDLDDPRGAAALEELGNPPRPGVQKEGTDRWSRRVLAGEREGDRVLAVRILSEVGTPNDLALLARLLDDASPVIRILAAAGILRLAGA